MEDTLPKTSTKELTEASAVPKALAELLDEHKGSDVAVLDLHKIGAWTDFFIIATATSDTHLDGLERHVRNFCAERDIDILRRSRKPIGEDEWRIIDLGPIVIHLMSQRAREFYDLERLYSMPATQTADATQAADK